VGVRFLETVDEMVWESCYKEAADTLAGMGER
jgi:hypothetical protein